MVSRNHKGFPGSLVHKESACNAGDPGSILGLGRSPGRGQPLQYSCMENLHGQEEPGRLQSTGRKESDMTEQPSKQTQTIQ